MEAGCAALFLGDPLLDLLERFVHCGCLDGG